MIKLAIVEDNDAYRKALQTFLSKEAEIEIVYVGQHLFDIAERVREFVPDIIIMDIDLPKISGIEGAKIVKEVNPDTNVLMLTVFEDEDKIFQSIKAGALGYLLKKDSPEKIIDAVKAIHKGESVMNGQIARKILTYFSQEVKPKLDIEEYNLTKREKEVLQLLIEGHSYKEIASRCFISIDTVFSHIRKIYAKLRVNSRSEISARFR